MTTRQLGWSRLIVGLVLVLIAALMFLHRCLDVPATRCHLFDCGRGRHWRTGTHQHCHLPALESDGAKSPRR